MDPFFGYRATYDSDGAEGRICVDYDRPLINGTAKEQMRTVLRRLGFKEYRTGLVTEARRCIGHGVYRRGAHTREFPALFDCSSFTKWVYGGHGIWLPRRAIDQRDAGTPVSDGPCMDGDLVFTEGWRGRYVSDPADAVGHVGLATRINTVIHATNAGVVEVPLDAFVGKDGGRGMRRYVDWSHDVRSYSFPAALEIEHERDVWWKVLSYL